MHRDCTIVPWMLASLHLCRGALLPTHCDLRAGRSTTPQGPPWLQSSHLAEVHAAAARSCAASWAEARQRDCHVTEGGAMSATAGGCNWCQNQQTRSACATMAETGEGCNSCQPRLSHSARPSSKSSSSLRCGSCSGLLSHSCAGSELERGGWRRAARRTARRVMPRPRGCHQLSPTRMMLVRAGLWEGWVALRAAAAVVAADQAAPSAARPSQT